MTSFNLAQKEEESTTNSNPHLSAPSETLKYKKSAKRNRLRLKKSWNKHKPDPRFKEGRWETEEHRKFIKASSIHGNNWKKIEECIKTRSAAQIRSHAQKYIIKLRKKYNISLRSKRISKNYNVNTEVTSITEEDKKMLEVFNFFEFHTYSDTFLIYQAHKDHDAKDCHFRKKKKVFSIEKTRNRFVLEKGISFAIEELTKMIDSNQSLIAFLTGKNYTNDFQCKREVTDYKSNFSCIYPENLGYLKNNNGLFSNGANFASI